MSVVMPSDLVTVWMVLEEVHRQLTTGTLMMPSKDTGTIKTSKKNRVDMGLKGISKNQGILRLSLERQLVRSMSSIQKIMKQGVDTAVCAKVPDSYKKDGLDEDDKDLKLLDDDVSCS